MLLRHVRLGAVPEDKVGEALDRGAQLGALIAGVGLIALPVYNANEETGLIPPIAADPSAGSQEEVEGPQIQPYIERLDSNSITWGIAILLIYAVILGLLDVSRR